jgi:crotonobetainyl-CoA:carnitine CoA-transferase CaiB-like acyl-CoA transferase
VTEAALEGIRVIDLAGRWGEMAGRVLADLGAEVICVEPPEGSPSRSLPPLGPDGQSYWWHTLALGKRSVVIDLADAGQRPTLERLLAGADVCIETFQPGQPGAAHIFGLDYETLRTVNPDLVVASITPFGQTGPRANDAATDLTVEASGGLVGLQGPPDRPPIPIGLPQACLHAGVQAAADILIALNARHHTGTGQHLDVSAQAAMISTLMNATGWPSVAGGNPPGLCDTRHLPRPQLAEGMRAGRLLPCKDGYCTFGIQLPGIGERTLAGLMIWLAEAHADLFHEDFEDVDWSSWMNQIRQGHLSVEGFNAAYDAVAAAFKRCSKAELLAMAIERKLLIAPILDGADLMQDEQLRARDFWKTVEGLTFAGPFAKLSRTPIEYRRAAPQLGADQDLLDELPEKTSRRRSAPARTATGALAGLKVADFAWVGVGPIMAKALADHGATVIHIESSTRLDVLRTIGPFKDSVPGVNRSQFFANFNTNKKSIDLDFNDADDLALARRIADWADVLVESFVPGTMARFGLDYETLTRERDDLVMLSTCMRGQSGPQRGYSGFGNQGAALAGLISITGWPDLPPAGPWGAYTDFIAPRFGVAAIAAALLHRHATGKGQHIDVAQIEAGIHFMGPLTARTFATGEVLERPGMASMYAAPNGVFAAEGGQSFVAISVETDEQWRALAQLCGTPETAHWSFAERSHEGERLHDTIAAWVAGRSAAEVESCCQAEGIPAHPVLWPSELYEDPQLLHREFFQKLTHPEMGSVYYDGHATRFSGTPPKLVTAAPLLGQHSDEIRAMFAERL